MAINGNASLKATQTLAGERKSNKFRAVTEKKEVVKNLTSKKELDEPQN